MTAPTQTASAPSHAREPVVEVFYWNPTRPRFRGRLRRLPLTRPVNNFGDLLGPNIVAQLRRALGCTGAAVADARLLTVGSVLHFAHDGDTIWGSGVNGKVDPASHRFSALDVRALRGPRTHDFLKARGIATHDVPYGDPGLLLGIVRPDLLQERVRHPVTIIQNLNDSRLRARGGLSPRRPLETCLRRIARSRLVVGSSLHAIIIAEALGIPARLVRSQAEPEFKYADYYLGTGRPDYEIADSVGAAIAAGGMAPPNWDPEPLLAAFPGELWHPSRRPVAAPVG